MRAAIVILMTLGAALCLLAAAPSIDHWEKTNGYPYGHLCDLYRNCEAVP